MGPPWSCFLEANLGKACLSIKDAAALASFDADDCLRVAFRLRLPIFENGRLPVPVDVLVGNTSLGSEFKAFRIQTVRDHLLEPLVIPFTDSDDPFDEDLGKRYFGIYGVFEDSTLEHIADRSTYALPML